MSDSDKEAERFRRVVAQTSTFAPIYERERRENREVCREQRSGGLDAALASADFGQPGGPSQHEPGAKLDAGKPDASLLLFFADALEQVALVGTMGQEKYTRGGWLHVENGIDRYTAALLRHLMKETSDGAHDTDPWYETEEGKKWAGRIRHDAQVAWNALARLQLRMMAAKPSSSAK